MEVTMVAELTKSRFCEDGTERLAKIRHGRGSQSHEKDLPAVVSGPVGGAVLQLDRLPKLGPNGNASFQTRCKQTLRVGVALSLGRDEIRAR
jgi:hypothetical protein